MFVFFQFPSQGFIPRPDESQEQRLTDHQFRVQAGPGASHLRNFWPNMMIYWPNISKYDDCDDYYKLLMLSVYDVSYKPWLPTNESLLM